MNKIAGLAFWLIAIGLLVVSVLGFLNRQEIYDWWRLRDYSPPPEIAQLATDTTMQDKARRLFYVYRPELNDRLQFNQNCTHFEETIVLGCYVSNLGIYLFDVDDPRLHGVQQVTAAHELLHAAYDRLGAEEKARVDKLTADTFASLNNQRIIRTIENYKSRDPSVVPNELHSILATEVRELPEELEEYYKKYFSNRLKIVEYSEKYESILTERKTKAVTLEAQITGLKNDIELTEAELNQQRNRLQQDRANVTNQQQARAYNQRVEAYNASIKELNSMIDRHNKLIEEYKRNAFEAQELYEAIDSRPTI